MKENLNLFLKFFLTARRFCVIIDLGENQVRRGRGQKKVIIVLLLADRRFAPRRKKDLQLQMQVVAFINVLLIIIALLLIGAKKKKKKKKKKWPGEIRGHFAADLTRPHKEEFKIWFSRSTANFKMADLDQNLSGSLVKVSLTFL